MITGGGSGSQSFMLGAFNPVHAVLTGIVLLAALVLGPWLARRAGRIPDRVDPLFWHAKDSKGRVSRRERRVRVSETSPVATWVTLLCVWIAALFAIAYIWLSGKGATPEDELKTIGPGLQEFGWRLGVSLLVVAISLSLGRVIQRAFVSSLAGTHLNHNLVLLGRRLIYVSTLILGAIVILAIWGTGLVVPVALLGALTVALSLALQGILSNLVAGVYLLIEHPFTIGQTITATSGSAYTGVVEDVRLRVTLLRLETGERVLIPNSAIFNGAVVNRSASTERRTGLKVTVADPGAKKVRETQAKVLAAVRSQPEVLAAPAPEARVTSVSGGKLVIEVVFWLQNGREDHEAGIIAAVIERVRGALGEVEIDELPDA